MDIRDKIKKLIYKNAFGFSFLRIYLAVNIINVCNRRCSFCPYHGELEDNYHTKWFRKQPILLPLVLFKKFLEKFGVKKLIKRVAITGKGEPMLHPNFYQFCALCDRMELPFTVTTNGDYPDKIRDILHFKYLVKVKISLYDDRNISNIVEFNHPKVDFYNQTGEKIEGIPDGFITANYGIKHERALKDFNNETFCAASFNFLTVNTDGSVVPCYSYDEVANIKDSLWKIWNGRAVRRYRNQAVNGREMEYADCKNCGKIL